MKTLIFLLASKFVFHFNFAGNWIGRDNFTDTCFRKLKSFWSLWSLYYLSFIFFKKNTTSFCSLFEVSPPKEWPLIICIALVVCGLSASLCLIFFGKWRRPCQLVCTVSREQNEDGLKVPWACDGFASEMVARNTW